MLFSIGAESLNRILIVEDEKKLLEHLCRTVSDDGFVVTEISSYQELLALSEEAKSDFDLVLLDRLLEGKDAGALIPKLKMKLPTAKILVLSAINTPGEKAQALDLGADDYLAKPYAYEELLARMRALLRRAPATVRVGNLLLNVELRTVSIDDEEMPLTNREFMFLRTLAENPGKIFSKNVLYEKVWEMSSEVESNVIETTVNRLRKRLSELNASIQIKNSRNLGYWIEE